MKLNSDSFRLSTTLTLTMLAITESTPLQLQADAAEIPASRQIVEFKGVICQNQLTRLSRYANTAPVVRIRAVGAPPVPYESNANFEPNIATGFLSMSLGATAGLNQVAILTPYGVSNFRLAILPGRDRHVVQPICNTVYFIDSRRALAGAVPLGMIPAIMRGDGSYVSATIDGGAYYFDVAPESAFILRIYFSSGRLAWCDIKVGAARGLTTLSINDEAVALARRSGSCRL